jgi:signal transduction histidine kinase
VTRRGWSLSGLDARVVDGLLVSVLLAAALVEAVADHRTGVVSLFGATLTVVPLLARRRYPIAAYLLQSAGGVVWLAPPLITTGVAWAVGVYSMGLYSRHRLPSFLIPLAQAVVLAVIGIPQNFVIPSVPAWTAALAGGLGMWLVGNATRAVEERSRRLTRERELVARVAVQEERSRIARELHDVVAHSVTSMVVQAGSARTLLATQPDRASEAARSVEASGREALGELRRMLGLLGADTEDPPLEVHHR